MNTLVIEKQTGGYFKFTLNGDTANAITSIQNDLLAVGTQLHFKTGNGANIIKEQFIYPADLTVISGGTFTFTTVAQVWNKLIEIGYFAWLGGGGTGGVDRFDELLDTFSYTGKAGKVVVVDNSELKLVPVTFYNKRLFTELEDTPSSLVPNKMVVVNEAGTSLILQDQPTQPEQLLNSVGYFDYNDLITQTFPLSAVANTALKLTNDTNGANTSTSENPYGVSYVWDNTTNAFNFSELSVGDTVDIRIHVQITTTTSNQKVSMSAKFGIGSVSEFTNAIYENTFKSSGLHEISFVSPFYMGSTYITDYPAELYLTTDASASVKVDGWYIRIIRKNINVITVDYTVPDATNLVKGIIRLGGDLAGTADSPTVPGLSTKVPTTRTISTTSPLLGGGALSSNLTLSIQQGGSTQNGYISSTDWLHFEDAYNNKITNAAVTGTTTKTLTLTQQDGGTLTTSWSDLNTDAVTSVFGRTGAVVSATGDYTTTQVTEGTNLYYTNTRVSANTDVAANTAARHSAVTLGASINGLSLTGQTLSLALASTSTTGALSSTNWNTFNGKQNALSGTGIVKSTAGVISYLTDNTANWDSAYNDKVTSATVTGTTTKTLTLTQQDGGTLTTSWTDNNTDAVTSVFGRTGDVIAVSGDYTTSLVTEGTNLYYTEGRVSANTDVAANTAARHSAVTLGALTNGLSLIGQELTLSAAGASSTGSLSSVDWNTFNNKQNALTNPVTGTGTTNYIPKFTGSTAIGNSQIFDNGTNVLINNTTALDTAVKLQVTGSSSGVTSFSSLADDVIFEHNTNLGLTFATPNTALATIAFADPESSLAGTIQYSHVDNSMAFATNAVERMRISSTGNVGIATTNPLNTLSVAIPTATTGKGITLQSVGGTEFARFGVINPTIDNTSFIGSVSNNNFAIYANNAERMRITSAGNVGIGTTSPANKLHIVGDAFANSRILLERTAGAIGKYSLGVQNVSGQFGIVDESSGTSVDRLVISPTGNVGIGTTSPTAKLEILGSNSAAQFLISRSETPSQGFSIKAGGGQTIFNSIEGSNVVYGSYIFNSTKGTDTQERMAITSTGNVGIGTTTPATKLHLLASAENEIRVQESTNNAYVSLSQQATTSYIIAGRTGATPTQALSVYTGGSERMRITSGGNVGIGTSSPSTILHVASSGNPTFTLSGTDVAYTSFLELRAAGAGGSVINANGGSSSLRIQTAGTERMRITSGGDVGIGTTTPTAKLDIRSSLPVLRLTDTREVSTISAPIGVIEFFSEDTSGNYPSVGASIQAINLSAFGSATGLSFSTNADSVSPSEKMRITSDGNVGIGTNAPTDKLEVTGTVKVSSSVQVGDNATAASATNVGAIRYRSDANNSYMDMVMQTGASTYAWVNVVQNNW